MIQLREFLLSIGSLFANLFQHPDWRNMADVLILTLLIYQVIKLVMHTRSSSLFKGIAVVLVMAWLANALHLSAVSWLLTQIISMGLLFIVILFQPEFRRGLEQIGRSRMMRRIIGLPSKQNPERVEENVAEIVRAMSNMSRKRIGALIVVERHTGLGDVIESGTRVDAQISQPLIENIFEPNTPLHDGAMVIRNRRIEAAACILPLSEDITISRDLGTRHRAAIGITETNRHHRDHRRRLPDRVGGDGHHLHGQGGPADPAPGRALADHTAHGAFHAGSKHVFLDRNAAQRGAGRWRIKPPKTRTSGRRRPSWTAWCGRCAASGACWPTTCG